MIDAKNDLIENIEGFFFWKFFMLFEIGEKLLTFDQLGDNIEIFLVL